MSTSPAPRGTYRAEDGTPVEFADALKVWTRIAYERLQQVATHYNGLITYKELAQHVQRVPHLVVRHDLAFARIEHAVLLFQPGDDAFHRIVEVVHRHRISLAARGEQCCLVDEIGEVRPGKAGSKRCDLLGIDVRGELHLLHVHAQDLDAPLLVGPVHQRHQIHHDPVQLEILWRIDARHAHRGQGKDAGHDHRLRPEAVVEDARGDGRVLERLASWRKVVPDLAIRST